MAAKQKTATATAGTAPTPTSITINGTDIFLNAPVNCRSCID